MVVSIKIIFCFLFAPDDFKKKRNLRKRLNVHDQMNMLLFPLTIIFCLVIGKMLENEKMHNFFLWPLARCQEFFQRSDKEKKFERAFDRT